MQDDVSPLATQDAEEITTGSVYGATQARIAAKIGLIFGIIALLIFSFKLFGFVHDDAFITYRYASNLLHGLGPVFNPGEHTEGFSCPLYLVFTSILMVLPGDVLIKAKLIGVIFAALALWKVWQIAGEIGLPDWASAATAILIGVNSSIAMSAVDGMETSFQMFLIAGAALAFIRERRSGNGISSAFWLLAVGLNRSEGILFFVMALIIVLLAGKKSGFAPNDKRWMITYIVPMTLFFAWRWFYYGDLMPNTYYAKNVGWDIAFEKGPIYLLRTVFVNLNERMVYLGISAVLWLLAIGGSVAEKSRKSPELMVIPLFVIAQTFFALRTSGDWMQGWRYMNAVAPIWILLVILGIRELAEAIGQTNNKTVAISGIACCGLVAAVCLIAGPEFVDPKEGAVSWADRGWTTNARGILVGYRMENTILSADFVNKTVPPGSTVAFSEMGALPYYTPKINWLDTYGLTDRTIARLPGVNKYRTGVTGDYKDASTELGKHILERRPDYIMQWAKSGLFSDILNGAYRPFASTPLKPFDSQEPVTLLLWKRIH